MKTEQNRKCAMCEHGGRQSQMAKLFKHRYEILKPWYPDQMKSPTDWVHKTCLAALGLHPYPKDMIPLDEIIGSVLTARIQAVVAQHPEIRGPRQLIDTVFKQMRNEFRVPTNEGHKQLRYMISHWVTTRLMGNGRGGVSSIEDGAYADVSKDDVIQTIDVGCRLSDWILVNAAPAVKSTSNTNDFIATLGNIDFANTPVEKLKAIGEYASVVGDAFVKMSHAREKETIAREKEIIARIEENVSRKAIIDSEIVLVREKRVAAPVPDSAPVRKRARVEPILNQNGPLSFQQRRSISHVILGAPCKDVDSECAPPLEDVFALVHKWFADRQKKPGKCDLHTRTVFIRDVPVVYGWPEGHKHTFFDTRYHDQLLQHVKNAMCPNAGPTTEVSVTATEPPTAKPMAPCFHRMEQIPKIPPELQPIAMSQQQRDIQCLITRFGVTMEEWPARPNAAHAMAKHTAAFVNQWMHMPDAKLVHISGWMK